MTDLINGLNKSVRNNSSTILTVAGVAGTVTTAVLAAKASFEAAKDIQEADPPLETWQEKVKLVWVRYIPAGFTGGATVASIIGSNRISNKRTAAAVAAYSVAETALNEYREKVVEQIGERKEQTLRDQIAQDSVNKNPPSKEMVIVEAGKVLCCELLTRRYFLCDMETLKRSQNDINSEIIHTLYSTLSDFYYLIGLPPTQHSSEIGWDSDKLMELEFSSVLTEDGRPCLAFSYNYTKPI